MADFLLNALLAGLALALVAGPLGSFVVWRRMAYFGDTLSHAALLGVALGLMLDVSPTLAVTVGCVLLAVLLVTLQTRQPLASDTLLGILAHSTLSLGLVVLSFMREVRIDLMSYLFGDLLAVGPVDLAWILAGSALVLLLLSLLWRPLLAITVHEELARVEGLPVAANGQPLVEEPLFWDCVVYDVGADESEVEVEVQVAGRTFRSTLPVVSLEAGASCPERAD